MMVKEVVAERVEETVEKAARETVVIVIVEETLDESGNRGKESIYQLFSFLVVLLNYEQ